jgi:hypothetical protein
VGRFQLSSYNTVNQGIFNIFNCEAGVRRRREFGSGILLGGRINSVTTFLYSSFVPSVVLFTMLMGIRWATLALICVSAVGAQSTLYQLTTSVSNPAPVPGQPFVITWTGGEADEAVYIVLNNYFPDLPNQDIIYGGVDILCEFLVATLQKFWTAEP